MRTIILRKKKNEHKQRIIALKNYIKRLLTFLGRKICFEDSVNCVLSLNMRNACIIKKNLQNYEQCVIVFEGIMRLKYTMIKTQNNTKAKTSINKNSIFFFHFSKNFQPLVYSLFKSYQGSKEKINEFIEQKTGKIDIFPNKSFKNLQNWFQFHLRFSHIFL